MDVLLILEIISLSSEIVTLRYFCIASSIFAILSSETDGRPESCLSWTSLFKLSAPLRMCCILTQTFFRKLFTNGNECHLAQCFLSHKTRITGRNSYLVGKARRNSMSNGCQAKTERHSELVDVVMCVLGKTKTCVTARLTSIQAFLVSAVPWESCFTANTRTFD